MKVRDARPEDAAALAALLGELGYPDHAERVGVRALSLAADPASFLLVVDGGEGPCGLASASVMPLLHEDGSWCRLSALVLAEGRRHSGIGRALVTAVEDRAQAAGCRYLEVTSGDRPGREAAQAFYRALGLEKVSRRNLKEL